MQGLNCGKADSKRTSTAYCLLVAFEMVYHDRMKPLKVLWMRGKAQSRSKIKIAIVRRLMRSPDHKLERSCSRHAPTAALKPGVILGGCAGCVPNYAEDLILPSEEEEQ